MIPVGLLLSSLALLLQATPPRPVVVPGNRHTAHAPALTAGEQHATAAFNQARTLGSPELYAFLRPFPKGGDLHMHLSGAVYAETFIAEGARQGLCVAPVNPGTPALPVGQDALRFVAPQADKSCAAGQRPVADALKDQALYDQLVDSFSMRAFVPTEGIDGHDQFFATFARFDGLKNVTGEWLDEVATRAAAQNEQYLEIMDTPTFKHAAELGYKLGWPREADRDAPPALLAMIRDELLKNGLRDELEVDRKEFADAVAAHRQDQGCAPDKILTLGWHSLSETVEVDHKIYNLVKGCQVQLRFLYQVLRGFPPQQVFAQALLGFEVAQAELDSGHPLVVGINFVMPEDGHISMQDYHLQMLMLDYLHSVYPQVHISLHAGELAFGMVPPQGLSFHIREAIDLGHAERIGHGMDVLYETDPMALLKQMADQHIMVEVNLTSNDIILGETRTDHPLAAYRAAGVPVALSTDDEGVSRIDLTHEYVKGAREQNLSYTDLKRSARTSLEHAFIGGASLWAAPDDFSKRVAACAAPIAPSSTPDAACERLLKSNQRAAMQWELERRLAVFEATVR